MNDPEMKRDVLIDAEEFKSSSSQDSSRCNFQPLSGVLAGVANFGRVERKDVGTTL